MTSDNVYPCMLYEWLRLSGFIHTYFLLSAHTHIYTEIVKTIQDLFPFYSTSSSANSMIVADVGAAAAGSGGAVEENFWLAAGNFCITS